MLGVGRQRVGLVGLIRGGSVAETAADERRSLSVVVVVRCHRGIVIVSTAYLQTTTRTCNTWLFLRPEGSAVSPNGKCLAFAVPVSGF